MKTIAQLIRAEITALDAAIERNIGYASNNPDDTENAERCRAYAVSLQKEKARLQIALEREEAPLVKPQPVGVKIDGFDL